MDEMGSALAGLCMTIRVVYGDDVPDHWFLMGQKSAHPNTLCS